jgi:hypothetical protein
VPGTPKQLNFDEVRNDLRNVHGVKKVHNMHTWSLTTNKTALDVHLAIRKYKAFVVGSVFTCICYIYLSLLVLNSAVVDFDIILVLRTLYLYFICYLCLPIYRITPHINAGLLFE